MIDGVRALTDGNPFLPERVAGERAALGGAFVETDGVWHVDSDLEGVNPNLSPLGETVERLAKTLRERLAAGTHATSEQLLGYEALVRYLFFDRYEAEFYALICDEQGGGKGTRPVPAYDRFVRDFEEFFRIPGVEFPGVLDPAHYFAWGYQIRRAFECTYRQILGGSMPAAKLRAAVWQSVFTHNLDRYRRVLYDRMGDIPTLIVGESGTGKELVARAIALSRYIPFDPDRRCFTAECEPSFHALNLSALPSSLIESELFGHKRGSFTGAVEDRAGWFESCPPLGTIFLDEIGELEPSLQVKLLRVLQARTFHRVGETATRSFEGKIIAATNRNLEQEIDSGRFRRDLYYRICADVIRTPTLSEQIADAPDELYNLVLILARRIVGLDDADDLANEVVDWVSQKLGLDYPWPGNVRELEQCLRNVMIRGEYRPQVADPRPSDALHDALDRGQMTADDLLRIYCTRVYHHAGSYEEAARRLGLDRRTVKARVDPELLEALRGGA